MNIKAKITKVHSGEKPLKATAKIMIDDSLVIYGFGVIVTEKEKYVLMPSNQWTNKAGEEIRLDVCHPLSSSVSEEIEKAVFTAYDAKIQNIKKHNIGG